MRDHYSIGNGRSIGVSSSVHRKITIRLAAVESTFIVWIGRIMAQCHVPPAAPLSSRRLPRISFGASCIPESQLNRSIDKCVTRLRYQQPASFAVTRHDHERTYIRARTSEHTSTPPSHVVMQLVHSRIPSRDLEFPTPTLSLCLC